ncbi:hypothetical protein H2198_008104 [Neophaeococcomyces mojaviensis]|uniref:Uncharacterized protein n=1 Tax=Neophaeococcomyces mojaviensis TaxID=3383035 RepID=A0ACC2ZY86_9EURO|nr:hypothetical protein H2198_008104 [Knufia sp. JES_112]
MESDIYQTSPVESAEEREDLPQFPMLDDIDGLQDLSLPKASRSPSQLSTFDRELSHHRPHMLYQTQGHRLTPEERTRRLSILSARGVPVQNSAALASPFFPPLKLQNDLVLPNFTGPIPNRILAEDIDYLQKKGAFLIPELSLRNELLRNYVQYVHPYLPLLALDDFLGAIHKNDGSSQVSLLLFQAVMFAATAYIDIRYLTAQGYDSRKAARKAFFQRVKFLYDFDYESDRVTVVQAVLLMTYWYESPDDPKDVWHWLGVAISLARTIGINCNTSNSPLSQEKQKLWKRIWWSCYMRDRLVAIGMRRPIRIRDEDFDVPMLEMSDFETEPMAPELNRMIGGCPVVRDSSKRQMLASMCISVIKGCQCITKVLSAQYSILGHRLGATQETTMRLVPRKSAANASEVLQCDEELEQWYSSLPHELRYFSASSPRERNIQNDGEVINVHRALLTGIYMTASSALHRPQMMPAMPNLVISPELKELSKRRVREAASAITDIFRDLDSHDLVRYLPNTGVTILLPAIIIHLLDIKSPDSATRQLSIRRFQFCMQALQKLRDVYASADFAFSFLDAAIRKADVPVHDSASSYDQPYSPASSTSKHERMLAANLTPPPETYQNQIRSPSVMHDNGFFRLRTTTLSEIDGRRDSFAAMTPPSSDKLVHFSEVAITGGAAVTLTDVDHMHHSPASSVHDISVHSNGGYVEAERLLNDENDVFRSLIDEEAMKNDFEQLINLEGGSADMDLFSESLVDEEVDSQIMAVFLPASSDTQNDACFDATRSLIGQYTTPVEVGLSRALAYNGMTMPVAEIDDANSPEDIFSRGNQRVATNTDVERKHVVEPKGKVSEEHQPEHNCGNGEEHLVTPIDADTTVVGM